MTTTYNQAIPSLNADLSLNGLLELANKTSIDTHGTTTILSSGQLTKDLHSNDVIKDMLDNKDLRNH